MNGYPYRYYATLATSGILMFLMSWWDYFPNIQAIHDSKEAIVKLSSELMVAKSKSHQNMTRWLPLTKEATLHQQLDELEALFLLLQQSNLTLISASMPSREKVILMLEGDFIQWRKWVGGLKAQKKAILVSNFSFKQDKEMGGTIKMNLILQGEHTRLTQNVEQGSVMLSPMCGDTHDVAPSLRHYPLSQIKMKGTVRDKTKISALVSFPNHKTREVRQGDPLGNEQATIVEIKPNAIILNQNGKRISL